MVDADNMPAERVQAAFRAGMTARGYIIQSVAIVRILGRAVPVLAFRDDDGSYATLLFTTPRRWWAITLFSTSAALQADLPELERAAHTFHLRPEAPL